MNRIVKNISIISILCLLFSVFSIESEAQLFNKISKGLEKVNKGFEKVNKGLESVDKAVKGKNKGGKSNKNSGQGANNSGSFNQPNSGDNGGGDVIVEEYGSGEENSDDYNGTGAGEIDFALIGAVEPHITPNTKFLHKTPAKYLSEIIPVSDGIFATREYNRDYGYGSYYGFYTLDGKRITDNRYENVEGDFPIFDSGAVVLKDLPDSRNYQPFIILYTDGTARKLPETYRNVSQFHDGVATVEEGQKGFCIDTKGNKIWANLSTPTCALLKVGPLQDGLRCVFARVNTSKYSTSGRYGFIDNNGNWVIEPTLELAQDFKNGYSIVKEYQGNYKVIDTKGKTIYDLGIDPKFSGDFSDGYFRGFDNLENKYTFYDLQGNPKESYTLASGFKNGYAFVMDNDKFGYNPHLNVINTDFEVVASLGREYWELLSVNSTDVTDRKSGTADLFTVSNKYVITPDGKIKIVMPQRTDGFGYMWESGIGYFYPDRYAACQIVKVDDKGDSHKYAGYINSQGEFEVVICDDPVALEMLPGKDINGEYRVSLTPVDTIPFGPKFIN